MSSRGFWAVAFVSIAGVAGIVGFSACNDTDVHLYSAQKYDPSGKCVQAPVVIDIINGGSTGNDCAPECLVATTDSCGDKATFVSTQCGPYPEGVVTEGQGDEGDASNLCGPAFNAFADGALCPTPDAGDAEAGDAMMGCAADAGDAGPGDAEAGCAADAGDAMMSCD